MVLRIRFFDKASSCGMLKKALVANAEITIGKYRKIGDISWTL